MVINNNTLIIENEIEKRLIYRALNDLRMNNNSDIKKYTTLDQLLYDLKHHLYELGIPRFIF